MAQQQSTKQMIVGRYLFTYEELTVNGVPYAYVLTIESLA